MFGNSISVFFRLLNFISFIGLVLYFLYKKTIPKIRQKIEEKKALEHILHNNYEQLMQKEHSLKQELKSQKEHYNELIDKVKRWQEVVVQHQKKMQQEQEMVAQRVREKITLQEKNQAQRRLELSVIPAAITDARLRLRDAFSCHENEKEYVHTILDQIQKSV